MPPIRLDEIPKTGRMRLDDIPIEPVRLDRIGFAEAFIESPEKKLPFSPAGAMEVIDVATSAKRLNADDYVTPPFLGEVTTEQKLSRLRAGGAWAGVIDIAKKIPKKWTPELQRSKDIKTVTEYLKDLNEKQERGYSLGGRVGQITSNLPAFMIEFMATGGLKKLGEAAARKAGVKILGKYATTTVGKAALAAGTFGTGAAFRAAGIPNRAAEAIFKRQVPTDIKISDSGDVQITGPVEELHTSIVKGLGDHYIEILSEQAGEYMMPVISKYGSKIFNRLPFMGKLIKRLGKRWLVKHPGKTISDFRKAIGTKTGFHGVVSEIGEEYLGDSLRAIFNIDDFGAGADANILERLGGAIKHDTQMLPAMIISFSIPGTIGRVADVAIEKQKREDAKRQEALDITYGWLLNTPAQISTAEGEIGYESDFYYEELKAVEPKYKFKQPGIGKIFTPKWLLNRMLGVEILLEDVDKAELARQIEERDLNSWIKKVIHSLKKEKSLARLPGILSTVAEEEVEKAAVVTPTELVALETAEGRIGVEEEFEIEKPPVEEMPAYKLSRKLSSKKSVHIMRDLLDSYEEAPSFLNTNEARIFNQIRELTKYLRYRANTVREKMGLNPIREIKEYITHWTDRIANRITQKDLPIHYGYLYNLMRGLPKEVKNPTAIKRRIKTDLDNYFSKDLGKLLHIMTAVDLKDIYLMQPYQAAWDELQNLRRERAIPDSTYQEIEKYLLYDIRKHQALMDKAFNTTVKKPIDVLNKILPVKKIIDDPSRAVFTRLRRLGHISGLGFRLKPLTRNLGQRLLLLDLYRTQDYAKAQAVAFRLAKMPTVKHPVTGENVSLIELIREQDWYKSALRKFEDIVEVITGVEQTALYLYSKTHIGNLFLSNVEVSAITGYFDWLSMYQQSQDVTSNHYKNCIKQGKRLGIPTIDLLTQESDMMWNMREAVRRTQWEYFSISMPAFYRSNFNRAFGQFQSWWMNYFFNHSRECINQSLTGQNSLGRLLTPYGRLRAAKGMGTIVAIGKIMGSVFGLEMLKYLFIPLPSYLPPIPELIAGIIAYFAADTEREKGKALSRIKYGLKFWIPFSAFGRDLNRLLSGEYSISDFLFYKKKRK